MGTTKLYTILIIIVGVVGGYLFYSNWVKPAEPEIEAAPISSSDNLKAFQNLRIDFSALQSPVYRSLTTYGEAPVNPGVTGKKDIFAQ